MKKKSYITIIGTLGLMTIGVMGADTEWRRHVINDGSSGAVNLHVGDQNGDGHQDLIVAHHDAGLARVYLNPGPSAVDASWPAVTVAKIGRLGGAFFHRAPSGRRLNALLINDSYDSLAVAISPAGECAADSWTGGYLPRSKGMQKWTALAGLNVDGRNGPDFVAGGRGPNARIGWFEAPADPAKLNAYKFHRLRNVGWLSEMETVDMDGDGDQDILFTDRTGRRKRPLPLEILGQPVVLRKPVGKDSQTGRPSGCFWLENPGVKQAATAKWKNHPIGARGQEVLRLERADFDRDGLEDILVAVRPHRVVFCKRMDRSGTNWTRTPIRLPKGTGLLEDVAYTDLDQDLRADLVVTTSRAKNKRQGLFRVEQRHVGNYSDWSLEPISQRRKVTYGPLKLMDLDHDGDLDIVTTEAGPNGAVVWFENPTRSQPRLSSLPVTGHPLVVTR